MESELLKHLSRGEAAYPEFTAAVLALMKTAKARAQLREIHAAKLGLHVAALEARTDPGDMAAVMGWNAEDGAEVRSDRKPARDPLL